MPNTTTPVEWLDRALVAEARVAELERDLQRADRLSEELDRGRRAELAQIRAATLEECAALAQEFGWILPLHNSAALNEVMDDAACDVSRQIADAIRALGAHNAQTKET